MDLHLECVKRIVNKCKCTFNAYCLNATFNIDVT